MRKKIPQEIAFITSFYKQLRLNRGTWLPTMFLCLAPFLISWNLMSLSDHDGDGVSDVYDLDDDNDGLPDTCECLRPNPASIDAESDALSWTDGPLSIYSIGANTNGLGYRESGFEKAILDRGQLLTFDENPTYTGFSHGNISQNAGSASLSNSSSNAFISGSSGSGIRVDPVSGANSHSLTFEFTDSVYAFGFDLVDVFDCDNAGDDLISYEVYADTYKLLKIEGYNIGASQTGNISVYDASNVLKGSFLVGHNRENFIGFVSKVSVKKVILVATYGHVSAIDFHGIDKFTFVSEYVCLDTDGDGIPNSKDLDSDNDGISDLVEAGGADADGDGQVDVFTDTDGDGLADVFETAAGSTSVLLDADGDGTNELSGDFDGDSLPNWWDLDSDADGIVDVLEAGGADADFDGLIDGFGIDTDGDGLADGVDGDVGNDGVAENSFSVLVLTSADADLDALPDAGYPSANTDLAGTPDYLDIDADDDGIVDNTEGQETALSYLPNLVDDDGDGLDNQYDNLSGSFGGKGIVPVDTDGDTTPDYQDTDSDEDTVPDVIEGHDPDGDLIADANSPANLGVANGLDLDADGLDDGFDNDPAVINPTNSGLDPSIHPKIYGGLDQDWRAPQTLGLENQEQAYSNSVTTISESNGVKWEAYPNPVQGKLYIDVAEIRQMYPYVGIKNLQGKIVWESILPQTDLLTLDTQTLSPGIYLLEVVWPEEKSSMKIVVQ